MLGQCCQPVNFRLNPQPAVSNPLPPSFQSASPGPFHMQAGCVRACVRVCTRVYVCVCVYTCAWYVWVSASHLWTDRPQTCHPHAYDGPQSQCYHRLTPASRCPRSCRRSSTQRNPDVVFLTASAWCWRAWGVIPPGKGVPGFQNSAMKISGNFISVYHLKIQNFKPLWHAPSPGGLLLCTLAPKWAALTLNLCTWHCVQVSHLHVAYQNPTSTCFRTAYEVMSCSTQLKGVTAKKSLSLSISGHTLVMESPELGPRVKLFESYFSLNTLTLGLSLMKRHWHFCCYTLYLWPRLRYTYIISLTVPSLAWVKS